MAANNGVDRFAQELAKLDTEIADTESRLERLRQEREAFRIVGARLNPTSTAFFPPQPFQPSDRLGKGTITKAAMDAIKASTMPLSVREVTNVILSNGIRPKGSMENFVLTVHKALKRLTADGRLSEIRNLDDRIRFALVASGLTESPEQISNLRHQTDAEQGNAH